MTEAELDAAILRAIEASPIANAVFEQLQQQLAQANERAEELRRQLDTANAGIHIAKTLIEEANYQRQVWADVAAEQERTKDQLEQQLAEAKAREQELEAGLRAVHPIVCFARCMQIGGTYHHSEACKQAKALLAPAE